MSVDYRETLVVYLRSTDTHSAAKTLGISYQTLYARIRSMRKAGVKIPKLRNSRKQLMPLEVAQLNSLINKYNKSKES